MDENSKRVLKYSGIALLSSLMVYILTKKAVEYALNKNQESNIAKLHPLAQQVFRKFIEEVEKMGYNVIVNNSYRTFLEQKKLNKDNTSNAKPGYSYHNYGLALDINLQKGVRIWRKATSKKDWEETGIPQLAKSMGLRWGGDFKNYYDPIHFDYPIKSTTELRSIAIAQFGVKEESIVGNQIRIA